MKKYTPSSKKRGRPSFGDKPTYKTGRSGAKSGNKDRKPEMHSAVCSDCKTQTEVPFKPAYGKPVLCRDCFGSTGQERGRERGGQGSRPYKGGDTKSFNSNSNSDLQDGLKRLEKQLIGISSKMDQILETLSENSPKK